MSLSREIVVLNLLINHFLIAGRGIQGLSEMTGDIIRLNLTSKGGSKLSYLRPSVYPYYHVVTIGEGANRQVRTE